MSLLHPAARFYHMGNRRQFSNSRSIVDFEPRIWVCYWCHVLRELFAAIICICQSIKEANCLARAFNLHTGCLYRRRFLLLALLLLENTALPGGRQTAPGFHMD